jgi:hypothetical protein
MFAMLAALLFFGAAVRAQNESNMERALDQVSGSFSNYPARSAAPYPGYPVPAQPYPAQYGVAGQPVAYPSQNWAQPQPVYAQQPQVLQQVQPAPYAPMTPAQRFRSLYGAANSMNQGAPMAGQMAAPMNPRQSLMNIFFGDGSSSYSNSSNSAAQQQKRDDQASKLQIAQENLSVAREQAARAENDASRASNGSDKGARRAAASEARYAARSARAAADRASAAGYGGGPAYDVAAQARYAADRARAAADRADANANGGGW